MTKKIFFIFILSVGIITTGFTSDVQAGGCITIATTVFFDDADQEVGGISETYLTYDIAYYYDAGADGLLYYTSPTQIIDGDFGEGIDDTYFDLFCGIMYGIEVDYTTNNYQRNRVVCADTIHYVRPVIVPIPGSYYDPYELSKKDPITVENGFTIQIDQEPTEHYASSDIIIVGQSITCIRTPTVSTVTFEEINSPITTNPEFLGDGQRVFPGRQTPGDEENRNIVRVRAQLAPSGGTPSYTSGVRIYFRNFDVDDPSDDPIIDSNGVLGEDNRQFAGTPQSAGTLSMCTSTATNMCYSLTNSQGEATAEFTVTMQPGDNFVLAASTDQTYLGNVVINGTGLQDSTGNQLPTGRAQRTAMLSVWRRLHIEVDSMREADGNFILGTIPVGFKISPNQTRVVNLNPSPSNPLETDRFEDGRLAVGIKSLRVVSNTATTVTVRNATSAAITIGSNVPFQLYDDDDFDNDDNIMPDGDQGEDIPMPLTDLLTEESDDPTMNILAPAYIWPVYDIGDNNDNTVFAPNVAEHSGEAIRDLFDFDQVATEDSPVFWTAYLLGAYQYTTFYDDDPESPDVAFGVSDEQNGQGSMVFFELHSLNECVSTPIVCSLPGTSAHEIGHLLNAIEGDGGIMDNQSLIFSPTSLDKIRNVTHP